MKPKYDLNSLIKKFQDKTNMRFPGDNTHVRESVSFSMAKKVKRPGIPGDASHVKDHVSVSLQNK